jgi:hypothetical protein
LILNQVVGGLDVFSIRGEARLIILYENQYPAKLQASKCMHIADLVVHTMDECDYRF